MDSYWKHVWPSSEVLGDFLAANGPVLEGATVLELGAGATGIPGLIALKHGAEYVIFTDHPAHQEAMNMLRENCESNGFTASSFEVTGLDWCSEDDTKCVLKRLKKLHFVLASDVFFDPEVFEPLVQTISHILRTFPTAYCIFAYQERDCDWSIEDLLIVNNLYCERIRAVDTDQHTIHIGIICTSQAFAASSKMFAGIEGGATHSKMVILDENGKRFGEWDSGGLNYYLEGYERVADKVATWIRDVKKKIGVSAPLAAVGMGLSGAEDEKINEKLIAILKQKHGDVAAGYYLGTDSVVTIAASFDRGGVIVIAGTGSSCRLLKADGSVYGVGGWGHMIGDGGSGMWIVSRIIRYIFDNEDGLQPSPFPTTNVKNLLLKHFKLTDIIGILDLLYAKFEKSNVASFAGTLAREASDDPLVKLVFHDAGEILGRHVKAISKHFDKEMLDNVPIVTVGSVFKSWDLLKDGFKEGIGGAGGAIKKVTLYKLEETAAVGAAILAARKVNKTISRSQSSSVFDTIVF